MRKKRALDIDDLPKDVKEREEPAKVGRPAKPVEAKQQSEEDSEDDDSSDDDALGGLWLDKEDRCRPSVGLSLLLLCECGTVLCKHQAVYCRKRLLQMPELEREMELTRRKESQDDEALLNELRKTRKGDASEQPSEKDVCDLQEPTK